ncbi:MAG: hypothetical protein HC911_17685, partial [Chloroflexaceae bacterium]|nr:hypothetical protein [Chloroflexaceae bacterium]
MHEIEGLPMRHSIKIALNGIAAITLLVSLVWLVVAPDFEPLLALLGALGMLLGAFFIKDEARTPPATAAPTINQQGQQVHGDQFNAGGDIKVDQSGQVTPWVTAGGDVKQVRVVHVAEGGSYHEAHEESPAAAPTTPPPRQLSAPAGDFVGRTDDIDVLCSALTVGNQAAAICGVRGMGGIGKTELAMVVANRLADQFPDGQIVVDLLGTTTPLTPERALQEIIRAFDPTVKPPDDLLSLKKDYLSRCSGKRVLILADDARDEKQTRPLLPPAGCALIVTSRHSFTLPGMRRFDLDTLDPADAEHLLLAICPRIGDAAPELARLCGYLPLALRVSASLLDADETRAVARYLTQLAAERLHHLADPDGDPNDPQASVAASFALSY